MDISSETLSPRILIVDDESFYLELLTESLSGQYRISMAQNGEQALLQAQGSDRPDLILLDVLMPEMDGYEACQRLKGNPMTEEIPVIFLTAMNDVTNEVRGFELGAVDYITKPISLPILHSRVRTHLALAQQRIALEALVRERTDQIERTKDAVVYSMGALAEARDEETANHVLRTREYVRVLGYALADRLLYQKQLSERTIHLISRAAPLHDIGKVGVPDRVLQKKGGLTDEERELMNQHVIFGRDAIISAEHHVGATSFTALAREIAYSHHEKWDGSGYPLGLKGQEIPLSARMMALADVYDALVSRRYYKAAMAHEEAQSMIFKGRGTHFDPELVDAFLSCSQAFQDIAERYRDDVATGDIQ